MGNAAGPCSNERQGPTLLKPWRLAVVTKPSPRLDVSTVASTNELMLAVFHHNLGPWPGEEFLGQFGLVHGHAFKELLHLLNKAADV